MTLIKQDNGRWVFTGRSIPMALARKSWPDSYGAVSAAEKEGFSCMANGVCVPTSPTTSADKVSDALGKPGDVPSGYDRSDWKA